MAAPMRALATVAALALLASPARAEEQRKRGSTALALSASGTAVSLGIMIVAARDATSGEDADRMMLVGAGALLLAPSLGHWYAGDKISTGLLARLGGTALMITGAVMAYDCDDLDADCRRDSGESVAMLGAGVFIAGVLWDVATAPDAARRWNARHGVAITPTVTSGGAGLSFGGSF